jgi:hypothetical protein
MCINGFFCRSFIYNDVTSDWCGNSYYWLTSFTSDEFLLYGGPTCQSKFLSLTFTPSCAYVLKSCPYKTTVPPVLNCFFDFIHHLGVIKTTTFQKLVLLLSSGESRTKA